VMQRYGNLLARSGSWTVVLEFHPKLRPPHMHAWHMPHMPRPAQSAQYPTVEPLAPTEPPDATGSSAPDLQDTLGGLHATMAGDCRPCGNWES
jgi:hypothetical protein